MTDLTVRSYKRAMSHLLIAEVICFLHRLCNMLAGKKNLPYVYFSGKKENLTYATHQTYFSMKILVI